MANPPDKRRRGETKRARKGLVRMWEDTIVEALGNHWRSTIDLCTNCAEWQGISNKAIDTLIFKWKLPKTALSSNDKVYMRIEEKISTTAQQLLMVSDLEEYTANRVQFIVDCQPLANIVNGVTPITSENYGPICKRINNNLVAFVDDGASSHNLACPVIWRPRHFNQLADELANRAMNIGEDFEWFCDTSTNWDTKDLIICSDGGFRAKGKSASAAWIILDRPNANITCGITCGNINGVGHI